MLGFELQISGVVNNSSANCATTTAQPPWLLSVIKTSSSWLVSGQFDMWVIWRSLLASLVRLTWNFSSFQHVSPISHGQSGSEVSDRWRGQGVRQQQDLSHPDVAERLLRPNLPLDLVVFAGLVAEEDARSRIRVKLTHHHPSSNRRLLRNPTSS